MKQTPPRHERLRTDGFTLIELMIAVAIFAILSAMAYPNYRDYVIRARIGDATVNLQDMRTQAERFFQDRRTYASVPCTVPAPTTYFSFGCSADATTYTVTASGQASMAGFTYTVNQTNTRRTTALPAGWSGASAGSTCWVNRRDGSC